MTVATYVVIFELILVLMLRKILIFDNYCILIVLPTNKEPLGLTLPSLALYTLSPIGIHGWLLEILFEFPSQVIKTRSAP